MTETHADRNETRVPTDATPVYCERCGHPLPTDRLLALHRGLTHYDDLTEREREAYEAAYRKEGADIRRFRLKALAALVVLYFLFLFAYAAVGYG